MVAFFVMPHPHNAAYGLVRGYILLLFFAKGVDGS